MRALNLLRESARRDAFSAGLKRAGFDRMSLGDRPATGDVVVIWNRYGGAAEQADHFERHGALVLVAENNPLGNGLHGGSYTIARRHVAMTGGTWPEGGSERWDSWGINLHPFRAGGTETVILEQRGIGHPGVASPAMWAESVRGRIGGRIRVHPGTGSGVPLADDLAKAKQVVTWSSAAAVQALALGVPVWHAHPAFVGAAAARSLDEWGKDANRDEKARLGLFGRLAWAIWSIDEIRIGVPFDRLVADR